MKIEKCYNCGCKERSGFAEENGYLLVKCNQCGLLYLDDRPDDGEISQAHKQGKHSGERQLDVTGRFEPNKIREYMEVLQDVFLGNTGNINSWLDVGCGHGEFLVAVRQYFGAEVHLVGSEPNVHKQQSARQRKLNVSFFDLETHSGRYDIISILNVYSHIPDPPAFIEVLKNCLKPGGRLLIQTGDTADIPADEQCRPFYLPDHLSFASEKIVRDILQRMNFDVVSINKYQLLRIAPRQILKEIVKTILPSYRHRSRVKYYMNRGRYATADMYVLAQLRIGTSP